MQDFRKLDVWAKAHELAVMVYRATERTADRRYPGLVAQTRRAAGSIPANIAEGCGHHTSGEFARFLQHAVASASELEYHLLLAHDLELMPVAEYARLEARTTQVRRMLAGLINKVRSRTVSTRGRSKQPSAAPAVTSTDH
ncbi:MAG: four helix bundle protein [Gemmatimonadetes bacterium]|nr:four helix bundle protein [Gemmatimonadota bacterium]